ncbi:putative quinol monooxygenase [Streptomyces xiaopingdaonensis]|uniref:putative quinol monooxygenase n=1 Tax=Streptomyces xiaopingdaonensis TaxID=1565415 RepID=UPI00030072C4|nr:antibiotic biosynthesis monooxygenase [Streptomyces xiaopingdaonensis]
MSEPGGRKGPHPEGGVAYLVRFRAQRGSGGALAELLLAAADSMGTVPGCLLYAVNSAADDADTLWVTEVWRSAADHAASLEADGARELIGRAVPLLDGAPERTDLVPLGGWGLRA